MFLSIQRSLRLGAILSLVFLFSTTIRPAGAQDARCFPETGYCVSGRFRQYWEQNGEIAVFGFPLTPARDERNRDTGQTYLTQWFERNRFESHTENARPYDVLLGRLGDDRLRQLGRDWQAEGRESGPQPACQWFEQTGHNVCDQGNGLGFKTYWQTHGLEFDGRRGTSEAESLALFGLPLTAPRMETNSSGDTVLTQWFERARFEWHPDKSDEFKVLLGRLGDEVLRGTLAGERPGGRIYYVSSKDIFTGGDLYVMNTDGTGQTRLTWTNSIPLEAAEYAVSPTGDRLAYRVGLDLFVVRLNAEGLAPQTVARSVVSGPQPPELFAPTWSPDGSLLAYRLRGDIYASRLDGGPPIQITNVGEIPSPACLSWARNGYLTFRTLAMHTFNLFVVRSDGSDLRQVTRGLCGILSPSGDRMQILNGGDLWMVNLDGSNPRQLTTGRSFIPGQWSPDETRLLTVATNSGNPYDRDIYAVDAASGAVQQLTTEPNLDAMPDWSPDGKFVAFASKRTLKYGVYIMRADGSGQTFLPTPEESAAPQWAPH